MSITSKEFKKLFQKKRKNKYNSVRTVVDGYSFDSKKEAEYFQLLKLRQKDGDIKYFLRQIPFHLSADPKVTYRCDFAIIENDNTITFWEVKGYITDAAKVKIAMTEKLYGVKINIVW